MGVAGGGDSVQSTGSPGTKDDTSIYQTLSTLNLRIRFTFLCLAVLPCTCTCDMRRAARGCLLQFPECRNAQGLVRKKPDRAAFPLSAAPHLLPPLQTGKSLGTPYSHQLPKSRNTLTLTFQHLKRPAASAFSVRRRAPASSCKTLAVSAVSSTTKLTPWKMPFDSPAA